ncbi:MAG: class I SAM-dependent methyltransferase [Halobacteriota archaeon]
MYGPGDVRFFSKIARVYDVVMPAADEAAIDAGLRRADRPIERLVDLGGGSGRATAATDVAEPIVVDISEGMVRRARDRGFACVRGDARQVPIPDDAVDAVLVVDAFHHMPGQDAVLEEIARILRPGGVVVIREFDPSRPIGWSIELGERLFGMGSTFHTPANLGAKLDALGMAVSLRDHRLGYTAVGVVSSDDS